MNAVEQQAIFDRWVTEHAAVLHHVANGFAAGADRHDLMQELLLALWRAAPAFRREAQAATFVFRVAHNTALTWKRGERNYRRRLEGFEMEGVHETHATPASEGRERETLEWLYAQIRELPPIERSLLLLHLDGVSYAGIAEIHGLTETNVGARLSRLKQKLTQNLETIAHELR